MLNTSAICRAADSCHYDETLRMDVWTSYMPKSMVMIFKDHIRKKYNKNVDVQVLRVLKPEDFYDRVRAGISDVISPSHNFFKDERTQFIANRLILPVDRGIVTNLEDVQPQFIQNDFVTAEGKLYGVPIAAGGYSLLYHKDQLTMPPTTWNILWEEKMKGRYALSKNFYEANIYLTGMALGYKKEQLHDVAMISSAEFKLKLRKLLENALYWEGVPTQEVIKNAALTTAWGLSHSITGPGKENWLMAFPSEGVSLWVDYLAVTRNVQRNPFAQTLAMEWLNFVIGKEFQQKIIAEEKNYLSTLNPSSEHPSLMNRNDKEVRFISNQKIYWPVLTTRERNAIKMVYDQVLREIATSKIKN